MVAPYKLPSILLVKAAPRSQIKNLLHKLIQIGGLG